ncbi:MAG: hypothetical protein ABEH80_09135 [Halobaculum sp.]|jgi:hypothetical protein
MPSKDVPTGEKSIRERGTYANDANDPTLASYLSSAFFLLSVPTLILIAYGGFWLDFYSEQAVVFVFGGLLVASITLVLAVIHHLTGR